MFSVLSGCYQFCDIRIQLLCFSFSISWSIFFEGIFFSFFSLQPDECFLSSNHLGKSVTSILQTCPNYQSYDCQILFSAVAWLGRSYGKALDSDGFWKRFWCRISFSLLQGIKDLAVLLGLWIRQVDKLCYCWWGMRLLFIFGCSAIMFGGFVYFSLVRLLKQLMWGSYINQINK